jgi:hypothetical protein
MITNKETSSARNSVPRPCILTETTLTLPSPGCKDTLLPRTIRAYCLLLAVTLALVAFFATGFLAVAFLAVVFLGDALALVAVAFLAVVFFGATFVVFLVAVAFFFGAVVFLAVVVVYKVSKRWLVDKSSRAKQRKNYFLPSSWWPSVRHRSQVERKSSVRGRPNESIVCSPSDLPSLWSHS